MSPNAPFPSASPTAPGNTVINTEVKSFFDPKEERAACGVGFIVNIDGIASHKVIDRPSCGLVYRAGLPISRPISFWISNRIAQLLKRTLLFRPRRSIPTVNPHRQLASPPPSYSTMPRLCRLVWSTGAPVPATTWPETVPVSSSRFRATSTRSA